MSQVDVLETALENVLLEILTIRAERDSAMVPEPLILTSYKFTSQIPTREESTLKGLASREECRERMALLALRWLGELIHERGGIRLIQDICETVAARNPKCEGRMLSICDHQWDSIGCTATSAGWCA